MRLGFYCNWSVKPSKDGFYISSIHKTYLDAFKRVNGSQNPLTLLSNTSDELPDPTESYVPYDDVSLITLPSFKNYIQALKHFPEIFIGLKKLIKLSDFIYIKTFEPFAWILAIIKGKGTILNYHYVANPYEAIWAKETDSVFRKIFKSIIFYPEFHLICMASFLNKASGNGPSILGHIPFYLKRRMRILIESSLQTNEYMDGQKFQSNEIKILTVAALKSAKGHRYLFEGIKLFLLNHPDTKIQLKIVGDGEDSEIIRNEAYKNGLQDIVIFTGHLNGQKLKEAYLESNVFILTSLAETGPRVVIEAMAMKNFVICSDVGYAKYALTSNNKIQGKVIPIRSSEEVKHSLEWYIQNPLDRNSMIENAFQASKKFTIDNFVKSILH